MVGSGNPFVNDTSTAAPGPQDRLRRRMPPNPFLSNRHQAVAEDGLGRRHPGPATEQGMVSCPKPFVTVTRVSTAALAQSVLLIDEDAHQVAGSETSN